MTDKNVNNDNGLFLLFRCVLFCLARELNTFVEVGNLDPAVFSEEMLRFECYNSRTQSAWLAPSKPSSIWPPERAGNLDPAL